MLQCAVAAGWFGLFLHWNDRRSYHCSQWRLLLLLAAGVDLLLYRNSSGIQWYTRLGRIILHTFIRTFICTFHSRPYRAMRLCVRICVCVRVRLCVCVLVCASSCQL